MGFSIHYLFDDMSQSYTQIQINTSDANLQETLIALLADEGFEGFEEHTNYLLAYVPSVQFDASVVQAIVEGLGLEFSVDTMPEQNWNAVWESNFEPVIVDDFVAIRAHFHTPISGVEHELVITPKMSFGTGHHATTHLVMQAMRNIAFTGKWVFDFGTGTGILAILAEKLGAAHVYAIDNDDWSVENAIENATNNQCNKVDVVKGFDAQVKEQFDVTLANINKHVILPNLAALTEGLKSGGTLILSGLLIEDEADILQATVNTALVHQQTTTRNQWICMQFERR